MYIESNIKIISSDELRPLAEVARLCDMITERRRAIRLPMALPVELKEGEGITRDVSLSGVYFETDHPLAPKEPIIFTLVFEGRSWRRPIRLECEGEVVRVEPSNGKVGIATTISSYSFASEQSSAIVDRDYVRLDQWGAA